jgi:alpha-mannosidase
MKIKKYALITMLLSLILSPAQGAESAPDAVFSRILEIEKLIEIHPVWSLTAEDEPGVRAIKKNEKISHRSFTLRTTVRGVENSCGTQVLNTPMNLELKVYSRGLSQVEIKVGGITLESFDIDGSSGTGAEGERNLLIVPAAALKEYEVEIAVKNRGFKPARTEFWPPRRKALDEEDSYFSLASAIVTFPAAEANRWELNDWVLSMKIGYALLNPDFKRYTFIGAPFEFPDKRKTPKQRLENLKKILARSVMALDPGLLDYHQPGKVINAIHDSYKIAGPLREFAREFKVYLVGNAHIDIAWLWRMRETVMVAHNTYDTVIKNMAEFPELHYAQSQAVTYDWMEKKYPDLFEKIKQKVKQGTWEIVGGMWVEPDCNLIGGESWVRQLLYGKRYFKAKFDLDVDTGWNPDSFGYNWNMPQLYAKSGIKRFITQKIWWNDTTVFPYFIFWWQGVDGTKLLTYFPPAPYDTLLRFPEEMVNLTRYEASTGYKKALLLYGIGDHGGGPNRELLNRVRSYKNLQVAPQFIHSDSIDFLKNLEADLKTEIPVWKDELYLEYHRGTYTTQAKVKKNNRQSEASLAVAEKLASFAFLMDAPYPSEILDGAWKTVLTNQFHDILPGSAITPVYRDALEDYARAKEKMQKVIDDSSAKIASQIDTSSITGTPLVVFNTLSWPRTDVVSLTIRLPESQIVKILDREGKEVPVEVTRKPGCETASLRFIGKDLPPLGYSVFSLVEREGKIEMEKQKAAVDTGEFLQLENQWFVLKVNKKSGNIAGLFDKRLNKEFVAPGQEANVLQVFEDRPERWDAWNIGYTGRMWEINKADAVEFSEDNKVRKVIRIKKSFLGLSKDREAPTEDYPSSFFTQDIILYNDLDRIDIETEADWWEDHMLLKAVFPVSVRSDQASYEIPFALIKRTTRFETLWEKARFEVAALRWVDLADKAAGISLLNNCKYGHDIHANVMRISLLRAPTWPDPMADRGKHTFTYSIYTHGGGIEAGDTVKRAQELNIPLQAVITGKHPGELPPHYSFFNLKSGAVILETIKKAEDDNGIILRLYEPLGNEGEAEILFCKEPKRIYETDLMEHTLKEYQKTGKTLPLRFKKFEIKTLKLVY